MAFCYKQKIHKILKKYPVVIDQNYQKRNPVHMNLRKNDTQCDPGLDACSVFEINPAGIAVRSNGKLSSAKTPKIFGCKIGSISISPCNWVLFIV